VECKWSSLVIRSRHTAGRRHRRKKKKEGVSSIAVRFESHRIPCPQSLRLRIHMHTQLKFLPNTCTSTRTVSTQLNSLSYYLAGTRVCGYWSGNGRGALREPRSICSTLCFKYRRAHRVVVSDAASGWHCVIYRRVRDGGGFIAVLGRTSLVTRVVGDFTFSCAFFIHSTLFSILTFFAFCSHLF
jgi:hypothetical protein